MKLWIDNTGLQSAGLCVEGRARPDHDYDVRGLLQLATLIIYGNTIALNGFEDDIIAKRTQEIVGRLERLGITKDTLSICPVSEIEYGLACRTAADTVASTLGDDYNPDDSAILGTEPPDLPRGIEERQIEFVALAQEPQGSAKLEAVEKSALRDRAVGAVEYMMACSPALREAVARILATHPTFGYHQRYDLNILLRYHLNEALGEQSFSRYTPAIGRAERLNRRAQFVFEALGSIVDKAANDLRAKLQPDPLGVPSLLAALLQRSKGEPSGVLKSAMEFRQRSGPLRNALAILASKYPDDTPESRYEMQQEINELGQQLRRDVRLEKPVKFTDALEVRFVIGIPVLSASGKEILKWMQQVKQRRRTAVLTELVKASAHADFSSGLYKKLRTRSASRRA